MALLFSLKLLKRFILQRSLDFPLSARAGCGIKKTPRRCYRLARWLCKWTRLYGDLTGKINLLSSNPAFRESVLFLRGTCADRQAGLCTRQSAFHLRRSSSQQYPLSELQSCHQKITSVKEYRRP